MGQPKGRSVVIETGVWGGKQIVAVAVATAGTEAGISAEAGKGAGASAVAVARGVAQTSLLSSGS